ncbi:MAG: monooxygenase [Myxococcota bacterium]
MFFLVSSMGTVGCKAETEPPPPTWHADVRPIIAQSCVHCHNTEGGLTSIALDTYEDAHDWQVAIGAAVAARTMPPWNAEEGCNRYEDDFSLAQDEIDTIVAWVEAGGPEGDRDDAAPTVDPWSPPTLDRVDITLQMPMPYTAKGSPDDYRCFIVEWPAEDDLWVTAFEIVPDNTDVVHHVVPFIISPEDVDAFRQMDADEEGEGYTCYGGPGGDVLTLIQTRWLGSWTPGSGAMALPDGHGLHIEPGSVIVMQMHYNAPGDDVQPDQSAINVRVEAEAHKEAQIYRWAEIPWLFGEGMDIPANTVGVEHTFSYTQRDFDKTYTIHTVMPHMHTMGRSIDIRVFHPDGTETCLLHEPNYDFDWQRTYWLKEPLTIEEGDVSEVHCVWDNPTDQDVQWGEGTVDEMCLAVLFVTEEGG